MALESGAYHSFAEVDEMCKRYRLRLTNGWQPLVVGTYMTDVQKKNLKWDATVEGEESFNQKEAIDGLLQRLVDVYKPSMKMDSETLHLAQLRPVGPSGTPGTEGYSSGRTNHMCNQAWHAFWDSLDKDNQQPRMKVLMGNPPYGNETEEELIDRRIRASRRFNAECLLHDEWALHSKRSLLILRAVNREFRDAVDSYYVKLVDDFKGFMSAWHEANRQIDAFNKRVLCKPWLGTKPDEMDRQPQHYHAEIVQWRDSFAEKKSKLSDAKAGWELVLDDLCGNKMTKALTTYLERGPLTDYGSCVYRTHSRSYDKDLLFPEHSFEMSLPMMASMIQRKCMVHGYYKMNCSIGPTVSEGRQDDLCFWVVPGTRITLFAKAACVEGQCCMFKRGDEPIDSRKRYRGTDDLPICEKVKQMMNHCGVCAPFSRNEMCEKLKFTKPDPAKCWVLQGFARTVSGRRCMIELEDSYSMPVHGIWLTEHPMIRKPKYLVVKGEGTLKDRLKAARVFTDLTVQGKLRLSKSEVRGCSAKIRRRQSFDEETKKILLERKLEGAMLDIDEWIKMHKAIPYKSIKEMGNVLGGVPERIKWAVNVFIETPRFIKGWTGNVMEIRPVREIMHVLKSMCVDHVTADARLIKATTGAEGETASGDAYEWFGNMYSRALPRSNAGHAKSGDTDYRNHIDHVNYSKFFVPFDDRTHKRYTMEEKQCAQQDRLEEKRSVEEWHEREKDWTAQQKMEYTRNRMEIDKECSMRESFQGTTYADHVAAMHVFDAAHPGNVQVTWVDRKARGGSRLASDLSDSDDDDVSVVSSIHGRTSGMRWRISISDDHSKILERIEGEFHPLVYSELEHLYKSTRNLMQKHKLDPDALLPKLISPGVYKVVNSTKTVATRITKKYQVEQYEAYVQKFVAGCLANVETKCAAFLFMGATSDYIVEEIVTHDTISAQYAIEQACRVRCAMQQE